MSVRKSIKFHEAISIMSAGVRVEWECKETGDVRVFGKMQYGNDESIEGMSFKDIREGLWYVRVKED